MPSHLIFISLFLGIVSGKQGIELQADPEVKSIRITVAGQELALLTKPPWQKEIDLGTEMVPRELVATGYDAAGNEIARASQVLNVPRPLADVQILREGDALRLRYSNLQYTQPRKTTVTLDGAKLKVDSDFLVRFPKDTDWTHPHVIQAEMRFDDGVIARREAVLEGTRFSDTTETELTPIAVTETSKNHPPSLDGCFSLNGEPVRASAVEKEGAHVIFVQDPDPGQITHVLDPTNRASNAMTRNEVARWAQLESDTPQEILWPITKEFTDPVSQAVSRLFEHSTEFQPKAGLLGLLTFRWPAGYDLPRQYADAVAVAGIRSAGGRRRAVVHVIGPYPDYSRADGRAVRRYLEAIGVPLFVWSPTDVSLETSTRWGAIEDISTIDHLRAATRRLRDAIASQRIAWIHADPLSALRVKADERCGYATIAK